MGAARTLRLLDLVHGLDPYGLSVSVPSRSRFESVAVRGTADPQCLIFNEL
jgi:hypothetical protein